MEMTITKTYDIYCGHGTMLYLTFGLLPVHDKKEYPGTVGFSNLIDMMVGPLMCNILQADKKINECEEWIEWSHNKSTPFEDNYCVKDPAIENILYFIWDWIVNNTPEWFYPSLLKLRLFYNLNDFVELKTQVVV